jgi:hypothetical protein
MADGSVRTPGSGETIASDDIGGVKWQRMKIGVGADGAAVDVQPPDADTKTNTSLLPAAGMLVGSGGTWNRARDMSSSFSDALFSTGVGLPVETALLFNGATFDRQRGNTEGTLLASAARTATTSSSIMVNYNARGVAIILNVTVASGTGGLQARVVGINPVTAGTYTVASNMTAIVATGVYIVEIYPGITGTGGNVVQRNAGILPRQWQGQVVHGDASSYTYSLGYALVL